MSEVNKLPYEKKQKIKKYIKENSLELINFYNNGGTKSEAINNFDFVTKSIAEKIYNKSRWKHLSHLMKW